MGADAVARMRRCKTNQRDNYYGSSDRREREAAFTAIAKMSRIEWSSSDILRNLQQVIVDAPAKFWKLSLCPPTPTVAL